MGRDILDMRARWEGYRALHATACESSTTMRALLLPDLEKARYRLGTSVADRSLPYELEDNVRAVFASALSELAFLYVTRHRLALGDEIYDRLLLGASHAHVSLRPLSFKPPPNLANPLLIAVLGQAPRILLELDCGILASWWGGDTQGRRMLAAWTGLYTRAVQEMQTTAGEQTPYLLHWVLLELTREIDLVLEPYQLPADARGALSAALLTGLQLAHLVVKEQVQVGSLPKDREGQRLSLAWEAVCNPRVTFGHAGVSLDPCRFYPVPLSLLGVLERQVPGVLERRGPDNARQMVGSLLAEKKDLRQQAELWLAQAWLRVELLEFSPETWRDPPEALKALFCGLRDLTRLTDLLGEKKQRKELVRALGETAGSEGSEGSGGARERVAAFLGDFDPRHPARAFATPQEAEECAVYSLLTDAGDRFAAAVAGEAAKRFVRRTGRENDQGLEQEYEGGRLYRFGLRPAPFLKAYQQKPEMGHFFIDLKDYTRRTALLKEEVMADFIRRDFYEPILAIAREQYHGLYHLADRGGVYLNNLLGDAVSLSGDVQGLVQIARRIRAHLDVYARGLAERLVQAELCGKVEAIARLLPGPTREEGISRIVGEHLMAGSFIAHGNPPVVVTIDDPVWGRVQVSIAEKINESARGTARVDEVMAALQRRLIEEQKRTQNPALLLPFRVYIAGGSDDSGKGAALYNIGDALSGEALSAYRRLQEQHQTSLVDCDLSVLELEAILQRRFAFLTPRLRLVLGPAVDGQIQEIFRYVGKVPFKGLEQEGGTEVWEMVNPADPVGAMLSRSALLLSRR